MSNSPAYLISTWQIILVIEGLFMFLLLSYVLFGRRFRRDMILGYFTPKAIAAYFEQFWPGNPQYAELATNYRNAVNALPNPDYLQSKSDAANGLADALRNFYDRRFGWRAYALPTVLLAVILYFEASTVGQFVSLWLHEQPLAGQTDVVGKLTSALSELPNNIVAASLAGAYLIAVLNLISRVSSLSLLPSDIYYYALRLLLAPAVGYVLTVAAGASQFIPLVAFVANVIPIADFLSWTRSIAAKSLSIQDNPLEAGDNLINLAGVDADIASRLQDQGITTIAQLENADPVQLSMRTGFDFSFFVVLVDEAIAWRYLGKKLSLLREFGWSAASDIICTARESAKAIEEKATAFADAQNKYNLAKDAVDRSDPADASHQTLEAARDSAKTGLEGAGRDLANISSDDLVKAIVTGTDPNLKLNVTGLKNIVTKIGTDTYANFISNLIYDIESRPPSRPENPTGGVIGRVLQRVVNLVAPA